MSQVKSHITTDHERIRQWAKDRKGRPAAVKNTGGGKDVGIIRIEFDTPYSHNESLEEISWEEFFQKFDESNLAFVYQETTEDGQKSNFNKLISRESAKKTA